GRPPRIGRWPYYMLDNLSGGGLAIGWALAGDGRLLLGSEGPYVGPIHSVDFAVPRHADRTAIADTTPILILPGYADSGPDHWQSHWERTDARCQRVVQRDWLEPRLDDWLSVLDR